MPTTGVFPTFDGSFAAIDELRLDTTPRSGRNDRHLDELGQRFALAQDGLDFGPDFGFDANGWEGGRAHPVNV